MIDKKKIQNYCRRAHEIASKHGFHEEKKSDAHWLCLVICEVAEAVEADRKGSYRNTDIEVLKKLLNDQNIDDDLFPRHYKELVKGSVGEEFADICIRIFDFSYERYGEDNEWSEWMTREKHHLTAPFTVKAFSLVRWITDEGMTPDLLSLLITFMYDWAESLDIDLDWHIENKMRYNESRAYKHGKSY